MRSSQSAFVLLLVVGLMEGVWGIPTSYTTQAKTLDLESKDLGNTTFEPVTETTESEAESTTEDENPTTDDPTTESLEIELKIEADWQKFLV